jgi:hypothetical protein
MTQFKMILGAKLCALRCRIVVVLVRSFLLRSVITFAQRLLFVCFLLVWQPLWGSESNTETPITAIQEFYQCSEAVFKQGRDVRIKATVTYADENWQQLYVQDNKTGMFLDMQGIPFPLPLPEVVLLEGRTVLTNGFRRIENLSVQPLEGVGRPLMRNVLRASDLYLPGYGSILVRVRGVVTSFVEEDRLALRLDMDGTPVVAYVKNYRRSDLEGLLGARVHMEVVCSQQFGKDMRVERVWLLAGGWRDIHVDVPGVQDPFDAIPRDIAELQGTNAVRFLDSRVQVHGIVSSWQVADWIDVSDGTGTIRANIPFITINPMGSKYEVCGALKKAEDGGSVKLLRFVAVHDQCAFAD